MRVDARQRRRTVPDDVDLDISLVVGFLRFFVVVAAAARIRGSHPSQSRASQHEAIELGRVRVPAHAAQYSSARSTSANMECGLTARSAPPPSCGRRFLARANHAAEAGQGRVRRDAHRVARVARRDAASRQGHSTPVPPLLRNASRCEHCVAGSEPLVRTFFAATGAAPVVIVRGMAPTHDADA